MASILIRANTQGDHRFYAPAWNRNGTLRPGFAKGRHEPFTDYNYYIRWTETGKRKTLCVGRDTAVAIAAMREKSRGVRLASGKAVSIVPAESKAGRRTIASVTSDWLLWAKKHKAQGTYDAYKRTSEAFHEFLAVRGYVYLDQVTDCLMLDYKTWLEQAGYAEAYRWKLLNQLHGCLRRAKHFNWISKDDMPRKDDGHRYAEYAPEHTKAMLEKGCDDEEDWILVALVAMAGVRRNELAHMESGDFDFRTNEVTVRSKPRYAHKVKNRQERTIGIDPVLMQRIGKFIAALPEGQSLLFPATRGGVERHMERRFRRICEKATVPVPKKPSHAFRVSYATRLNRAGTDIETIRRLLGHYDIKTTQIYLRSMENQDPRLQAQVRAATAELGITGD